MRKATISAITSAGSGINAVVDDTSPELGGDLDVLARDIVSSSNRNIDILPNGSGKVMLDGNGSSGGVAISDGLVDIRTGTGTRAQVKFYCEVNNQHAQTIQPQPHSAQVTNTLTLPAGGNQELVGTIATQTLTNKSIVATQLTGTVANARLGSFSDNDFLKVDGSTLEGRSAAELLSDIGAISTSSTDTLTNKTLTSPVINGGTLSSAVTGTTQAATVSNTTLATTAFANAAADNSAVALAIALG